jgi:hypothetical protein
MYINVHPVDGTALICSFFMQVYFVVPCIDFVEITSRCGKHTPNNVGKFQSSIVLIHGAQCIFGHKLYFCVSHKMFHIFF